MVLMHLSQLLFCQFLLCTNVDLFQDVVQVIGTEVVEMQI